MTPSPPTNMKIDELIEEIIVDASGDDEQLTAFNEAFKLRVVVPFRAVVLRKRVLVTECQYKGNVRRGLTATCLLEDGTKHIVQACELRVPARMQAAPYLAAYRQWMGLAPKQRTPPSPVAPVELVVLSVKETTATCRAPGASQHILFRAGRIRDLVPGEIIVVNPTKRWTNEGNTYLSGKVASSRLDAGSLGLMPLQLRDFGIWNPKEHFWGDRGVAVGKWAKPIKARGPRPQYEMEQVLPGADPMDFHSDPIIDSNDLAASGNFVAARDILMNLCQADLRCLDAHAHLGLLIFHAKPADAIRHYEAGFRIGELSLPKDFNGLLPWGCIDNRPFLRCMNGYGLCLWRLRRFEEAANIFNRMLWLNPTDNQGVRFIIDDVKTHREWKDED